MSIPNVLHDELLTSAILIGMKQLKKVRIVIVIGIIVIFLQKYQQNQEASAIPDIQGEVTLIRIVDGDTLVVEIKDMEEKVRIIGIDTPESVKPNSKVECFGQEATNQMRYMLENVSSVHIETDPTQKNRDIHGRLLAHVFSNGENIGERMITGGYAYEYTYRKPYIYQDEYLYAQSQAQKDERGLWSPATCNGKS
ncbi:MAG: micrococcal nuclease [Candidatus Paceibacteria bacterium]